MVNAFCEYFLIQRWNQISLFFIVILTCQALTGCANYAVEYREIRQIQIERGPVDALERLELRYKGQRKTVLYWLNSAMFQRYTKQYEKSNDSFDKALQFISLLDALSLSEQVGSVIVNDGVRSYVGEDYEHVLIHVYKALNYLQLDRLDAARVEALKIDLKLTELFDDYGENEGIFFSNAWSRYLSGVIYEINHEIDEAMIAYRKAYDGYIDNKAQYKFSVPSDLKKNLFEISKELGLLEEHQHYAGQFEIDTGEDVNSNSDDGEFLFVFENGLSPLKKEHLIPVSHVDENGVIYWNHISTPYYDKNQISIKRVRLIFNYLSSESVSETSVVENIDHVARVSLDRLIPGIQTRAIARMLIKNHVTDELSDAGPMYGLIGHMFALTSEVADTRSWMTLPYNIHMARTKLAPGIYTVTANFLDEDGSVLDNRIYHDINIRADRTTVFTQEPIF